jgi:thiamine pyrophosphokinase
VEALGYTPDVILGDFDSLGYVPQKANVFPVEKDDTDAMLAVRKGLELGCDRFVLYGALEGPRLDHTVANFQTLQFLADRGGQGFLVGKDIIVTVLKNGSLTLPALPEGIVSVFCMGTDARGVTIRGLQYGLENGTLTAGFPLGVSNHFVGKEAMVSVEDGSLLIFLPREAMSYTKG